MYSPPMYIVYSSLRNKRKGLSGRPPCKRVAIGVARRGGRLGGERMLRIPLSCSDPVSHAGGPHVASFVVGRSCCTTCVCASARVRVRARAWRNALRVRACSYAGAVGRAARRKGKQPAEKRVGTLNKKNALRTARARRGRANFVYFFIIKTK